ncbi:hypothetical protein [Pseudomonas mangiferae]|uniref:Uncharacterized protein n=1 Tax=Pseudomonas mangiferae TaxID=2593654 RepID=A0A553GZP1_9PSED|nr:hypothetical protein [Pseudomonas mangiferae]TRX74972.1 hypothetical protein FM069_10625 [Pseudomonas mangiferae]
MKEELEELKSRVNTLLAECLAQWQQALNHDQPESTVGQLAQLAMQLSAVRNALYSSVVLCPSSIPPSTNY